MDVVVRTLSEFAFLADVDERSLLEIASLIKEQVYEPGQIIVFADEPCQGVYLIVQGVVSVRRLSVEGREYVLDYLGAGECLNLVPALDGGKNLATVEASTHATLYLLPCDRFLQIVQMHNEIAMSVLGYLAIRVRYLSNTIEDLALYTVRTRLARFLLARVDNKALGARRWTQEEIASHIGTVRDVVGRTLRNFAREGLVRREQGHLLITDRALVEREAMQQ